MSHGKDRYDTDQCNDSATKAYAPNPGGGLLGNCPQVATLGGVTAEERARIIREIYRYKPPLPETTPKFIALREAYTNLAVLLDRLAPDNHDKELASSLLRLSMMMANASVAYGQ